MRRKKAQRKQQNNRSRAAPEIRRSCSARIQTQTDAEGNKSQVGLACQACFLEILSVPPHPNTQKHSNVWEDIVMTCALQPHTETLTLPVSQCLLPSRLLQSRVLEYMTTDSR